MNVLITGAGGFVGWHLIKYLSGLADIHLYGTTYLSTEKYPHLSDYPISLVHVDLRDREATRKLLDHIQPDEIYHLAAQSFVPLSFQDPWGTLGNNIECQLNLILGLIDLDLPTRFLAVGSGEVYGPVSPDDVPVNEHQPLRPANPYSVSKITQDMMALQYHLSHQVAAIRVRPFNQIGPGQSASFVAPAFARQIARIEKNEQPPVMRVGNLDARRDFTDVRDMVRAYHLVMQNGEPGAVYNIGSGQAHSIQALLDTLISLTDQAIDVQPDPGLFRPVEVPIIVCDSNRIQATTGWKPTYSFEDSLRDVLMDWRSRDTR